MAIEVRKLKSGKTRYHVRVTDELGKYYPSKSIQTLREAERYESQLKERRYKSENVISKKIRGLEVQTFLDEWFEWRKHKISENWWDAQLGFSKQYVLPVIGRMKLSEVRPPHIGRVLAEMEELGRGSQTRKHIYSMLSKAFNDATNYFGYLEKSPVHAQDRPTVIRTEAPYLTPKECWKLLDLCKDHYLGPAIWVCALGGIRTSEIQELKWRNVDFEKGQILICEAFKRGKNASKSKPEPYPKQKKWLIVPMPVALSEYLKTLKNRFPLGFVAPAKMGGRLEQKKFYDGLKRFCKKAGVTRVSPHGLRHSCSEIWIRNGATVEDIRRLLGHSSTATTLRYVHRTDDRLIKLAQEIRHEL